MARHVSLTPAGLLNPRVYLVTFLRRGLLQRPSFCHFQLVFEFTLEHRLQRWRFLSQMLPGCHSQMLGGGGTEGCAGREPSVCGGVTSTGNVWWPEAHAGSFGGESCNFQKARGV